MTIRTRTKMLAAALVVTAIPGTAAAAEIPPPEAQIARAVKPAPPEMRDGATVLGYAEDGTLVTLREGEGTLVCLADDPADERLHVACYYAALEPFMARGRALRAEGKEREEILEIRRREIEAGELAMPDQPTLLYSLTGLLEDLDPETGELAAGRRVFVVYTPYATEASTGLSPQQMVEGAPWIMEPGEPWAHIMIVQGIEPQAAEDAGDEAAASDESRPSDG